MLKNLKYLLITVACAALVSLAISGTLANTNDGVSLSIKQIELERQVKNEQALSVDNLIPFSSGSHMLIPSNTDSATYAQDSQQWHNGSSDKLFADSMSNVVDKIVTVENNGTATAYVRTWIAFEQGSISAEEFNNSILLNLNQDDWSWKTVADGVSISNNTYLIMCATNNAPLEAGQTTSPSLMQLAMASSANSIIFDIDSNNDGLYNVLVTSEAYSDQRALPNPTEALIPWVK